MGQYVNPDNIDFITDLKDDIYVDKSLAILEFNKCLGARERFLCVSRPRRFGKTMMTNLMTAYYSKGCDSRHLFENLKLAQHEGWDEHLNKCNVIRIDMNGWLCTFRRDGKLPEMVKEINRKLVEELRDEFPTVGIKEDEDICFALADINKALGETFVVIFDEYDVLIREDKIPDYLLRDYLELLNSLFKNSHLARGISLAYLTGILPIVKNKVESKLNNFREYTMLNPRTLAPYFGFTEDEVSILCNKFGGDVEMFRKMYDGYSLRGVGHVYNPKSVVEALSSGECADYWTATGSISSIIDYIEVNADGIQEDILKLLNGEEIRVSTSGYQNNIQTFKNKDDAFTYLIHLGYLAYDYDRGTCRIPNAEISEAWINIMANAENLGDVMRLVRASQKLLDDTLACNADAVADSLKITHREFSCALSYNRESSLQSAILMAYIFARRDYIIVPEMPAGDGFADIAFMPKLPGRPAIIIELKMGDDPQVAINQIKARHYARLFSGYRYTGTILVGIAYNAESRTHKCIIEKEK